MNNIDVQYNVYFYPELSKYDFGWFRVSGPGLANCLFIAARTYLVCHKEKGKFISPSWEKISLGPLLRGERDKRHYIGLFKKFGISGIRKFILIAILKIFSPRWICRVSGLSNYFQDFHRDMDLVRKYVHSIITTKVLERVNKSELHNMIAIHVRLGDYAIQNRTQNTWYIGVIQSILKVLPSQKFLLFSDGHDSELQEITDIPNVSRAFYGDALSDLYAMSCCKIVIAADSTYSAWAAFLGNKPIIFCKRHFAPVYPTSTTPEFVLGECCDLPDAAKVIL